MLSNLGRWPHQVAETGQDTEGSVFPVLIACELATLCLFQVAEAVSVPPELARCKVDLERTLGMVDIVGTLLNLLVVVLVYVYTPV